MTYPSCKRCGTTDVETHEWFGEGPFHRKHLCSLCFVDETEVCHADD